MTFEESEASQAARLLTAPVQVTVVAVTQGTYMGDNARQSNTYHPISQRLTAIFTYIGCKCEN